MSAIHPTAVVEKGVELGENVEIGPFAVVRSGARIGDGCHIGPHAVIFGEAQLGARCRVHAGAVIGDLPQDLAFRGASSRVIIGDDCTIREGVTIHRGTKEGSETVVGPRCFLMAYCHLAHNVRLGERVILANGALLAGYVTVDDFAFVSGNCAIHQFCRIGRLAMVGGGAILTKDCPPYCTVRSNDLNRVTGLNVIGMRRAGMDPAARAAVKAAFSLLYRSGLNTAQAVVALRERFPSGPAAAFAEFISASARGICAGPKSAKKIDEPETE